MPGTAVPPSKFHRKVAVVVPAAVTVTLLPKHAGEVVVITGVGVWHVSQSGWELSRTTTGCDEVDVQPLSVTVRVMVIEPELAQLTRYGPAPVPETMVPPEKSQL